MPTYRKAALAVLLGVCSMTGQAGQLFTLQASGHSGTPYPGSGDFLDYPDNIPYPVFVHTMRIDLDSCVNASSSGYWNCLMTSSLTISEKTFEAPSGVGSFSIGPNFVSATYSGGQDFDGGTIGAEAMISLDLSATPWTLPTEWKSLRNFTVSEIPGHFGNASFMYYVYYDGLLQKSLIEETAFEKLIINPVPEPSTVALMGLAITGLAISRRTKR